MTRLHRSMVVSRDPAAVFAVVADPARYPGFFAGLTRWKPVSRRRRGPGARFRVLMKVGAIEAGGVVRVVDWDEGRKIGWRSASGIDQRGAWKLRPVTSGTEVRLEIDYDLSGGPVGWMVERMVARVVARNMLATLRALRRLLEEEEGASASPATQGGERS